jgi:hypothetical protein
MAGVLKRWNVAASYSLVQIMPCGKDAAAQKIFAAKNDYAKIKAIS